MNRALLQGAVEGLASAYGYTFLVESQERAPFHITAYPAAFMAPPKFNEQEGRRFGKITYDISLTLMRQGAKLSPAERNERYADMESELVEMFVKLSRLPQIAYGEALTITPHTSTIDHHGAIAMVATAQVTTLFEENER